MPATALALSEPGFDYAELRPEVRAVAVEAAARIRLHGRRAASGIVAIGQELLRAKAALPHGAWCPWLALEFAWSDPTARRYMAAAEFAEQNDQFDRFEIDVSALYLLASPSTPATVRQAALDRARAGGRVSHRFVKDQRDQAKTPRAKPADDDEPDEDEPLDLATELSGCLLLFRVIEHDPRDVARAIRPAIRPRRLEQARLVLAWMHAFTGALGTEIAA